MDIKIRGKRADNGELVYGYYLKYVFREGLFGPEYIVPLDKPLEEMVRIVADSAELWTTEKDKKNKEIYQGDFVIDDICHKVFEVKWVDCGFNILAGSDIRVVGNKTDNPEMLKA